VTLPKIRTEPPAESRPASHFRRLYQANPDPWAFTTSPYERAKYRHTMEILGDRYFTSGLEVGCSIGILTRMLAPCCASLLGIDIVEDPLQAARERCADQNQVRFERMRAPMQWPGGRFDLIILSEVLYFLSPDDIAHCARQVGGSVLPGAIVLLVNWLGQSDDPCSGDQAAERFIYETSAARTSAALTVARQDRSARYRLDLLVAP
jgi:SAM-dependent methyltransferase